MEKLLVQTRASDKDPAISDQKINGVPFAQFFRDAGIKVLKEELIASCHGNTEYSLMAARQMQALADQGHKIVAIESGGLYFARPSLEAVHATTVPIISVPLGGLEAFLAANLPAGVAAIGGVAPGNYTTAANVAKEILQKNFEGVYIWGTQSSRLEDAITALKLPVLGRVNASQPRNVDGIVIGEVPPSKYSIFEKCADLGIYSSTVVPDNLMRESNEMTHSLYVRGPENLAYFAAKIVAQSNPEVKQALLDAKESKAKTYKQPNITLEAFE